MKEQRINLETALLAKEKGFDEFCRSCFDESGKQSGFTGYDYMKEHNTNSKVHFIDTDSEEFENPKIVCTAPTQSLLQKWLREKHNISVEVSRCNNNWLLELVKVNYSEYIDEKYENSFSIFEDALELGLQEALKIIKN